MTRPTQLGRALTLITASNIGGSGGTTTTGYDGTFPGSGQVPTSTGSNTWAWASNVALITSNASNTLTGPFVNFASGSGISFAAASNTLTISATGGVGGSSDPAWVIDANAAPYSCIGDDSTDNTAGIQAAIDAAYAAGAADTGMAVVEFDDGIYRIAGALVTTGNFYAQVTLPERAGTASKVMLLIRPKVRSDAGYPGGLQSTTQLSNVIFKTTLTGQSYSGTHGTPSIFGGPDPEKTSTFSNIGVHFQGVSFRAPANPTVCALNLQLVNQAIVEDAYFDTSDTIAGGITQPTAVTGCSVLMPVTGNNGIAEYRGNVWAVGWYAGPGIAEHTRAESLAAYRCYVGINIQGDYYHAATLANVILEHCPYSIATVLPSAGISNPTGASGFATFNIHNLDIEDSDDASWADPVYHINDPGNDYRGRALVIRTVAVTGNPGTQTLTLNGATGYGLDYVLSGTGGGAVSYGGVTAQTSFGLASSDGVATSVSRSDHVHGTPADPGSGHELLISDTPAGSPLVFADILQNEAQDELLYAD